MPTVDPSIQHPISEGGYAPSAAVERIGGRSSDVPFADIAQRSDRDVESCENCRRHRVGLGQWLWGAFTPARPDGAGAGRLRLTLCRDCLSFRFPEYFAD